MKNINVLVVEDEVLVAHSIKMMLKNFYNCITLASSYEEAVLLVKNYDIALIDIGLNEKMTGLDLAAYINEKIKILFIFLTAHRDKLTIEKVLALQPAAYLAKPIRSANLKTAIDLAIQKRHSDTVEIYSGKKRHVIDLNLLLYAEADHIYVNLHFSHGKELMLRISLTKLLEDLPHGCLKRINRSQAVNPKKVTETSAQRVNIEKLTFLVSPAFR